VDAETLLARARAGELPAVLLVRGDRALAAPLAGRLAAALGAEWETEPRREISPDKPANLIADLQTLALFEPGKLVVVEESGWLADREVAGVLMKQVLAALPFAGGVESLTGPARAAAVRLLQVLRLHDIDPTTLPPERALATLPETLFASGKKSAESMPAPEARRGLLPLLVAAVEAGLRGEGEQGASLVADLVRDGLPERHLLLLVESAVAARHPVVAALALREGVVDAGRLEVAKGGDRNGPKVAGLERLVAELERETGARITTDAAQELARRTLREEDVRQGGEKGAIDADSSARFGAELRKLAALAAGKRIDLALVATNVEDRGEEDVWKILDVLGEGQLAGALERIRRRLAAADDADGERLALFGLLAKHARHLTALAGALAATGTPANVSSYPAFRDRIAPRLQGELPGVTLNPLAKQNPFPLHRAYQAASRFALPALARLPALVLETERRLKGDGDEPDAALAALAAALAAPPASRGRAPVKRAR
jgi:DNA polymerase III delta subunit